MKNDKNHDTSRNYVFILVGSIVVVQCEDSGLWTNGTTVGKGDLNKNNNRTYTIYITIAACLITSNSKHVKPTDITAVQYLWNQLDIHIVRGPQDDILKEIENWTHVNKTHNLNDQLNNIHTGTVQVIQSKKTHQTITETMSIKQMGE